MDLDRLKAKLRKFFTFFVAPPKTWRRPNIADILVYDDCNSEVLVPCLTGYRIEILHLRGETINVPCLWRAAFTAEFWRGNPIQSYVDAFIRLVQPRLVLTYIDNDPGFYSISKRFATIKTLFVQNGTRGEVGDVFGYLQPSDSYHVDYMLVHGRAIGAHYSKFISGNAIAIGSFKNNAVPSSSAAADKTVLFFSQFSCRPSGDAPFLFEPDGRPVRWDDFHRADVAVVSFLDSWCARNTWQLIICGRDFKKEGPEWEFFASHLRGCRWKYIPRSDVFGSYRLIDAAELVVFIDSTLGYESLARGKRTAAFSCRGWPSNEHAFRFGWPSEMPDSGPFWTNRMDEAEFCRILDYLLVASEHEWERDRQLFSTDLMAYDPGNSLFRSITSDLLGHSAPPKRGDDLAGLLT